MQLENGLWIAGGFYVDFDQKGQFRIIGPNNHLYCGLIDIPLHKIKIEKVYSLKDQEAVVKGRFLSSRLNLYYPAQDDIRTVRDKTFGLTFLEVRQRESQALLPHKIKIYKKENKTFITFSRHYEKDLYYASTFVFPKYVKIKKIIKPYRGFRLESKTNNIPFTIIAHTNEIHKKKIKRFFLLDVDDFDFKVFGRYAKTVKYLWWRTSEEIKHLITWGKTSGDRFGTIFPRDWMEAADLGIHDLTEEVRSYMYEAALKNVNEKGEGWHEDVVGEYKYEYKILGLDIIDRHMIDIEPRYLIGLEKLPETFLVNLENRKKIRAVARYLIKQARKNNFIIFKKLPKAKQTKTKKYYLTGNWRDTEWAYKRISQIIAPFDVNVVFYPQALKSIKKFQNKLNIRISDLDFLIKKWERKRKEFLFENKDRLPAYALALYGIQSKNKKIIFKKLKINHLDEAYLYTYCQGDQKEIKSFCQRLLGPQYFYTPSGPLIVAKNNNLGYTPQEYHGLVIWTKQVAYTILGLSKHLKKAISEDWPSSLQRCIKNTILKISLDMIRTFDKLNAVPEVHIDVEGKPRFFTDQPQVKGEMSKVQLWSAVGARRIIRKYYELKTDPVYQIK